MNKNIDREFINELVALADMYNMEILDRSKKDDELQIIFKKDKELELERKKIERRIPERW